MEDRVARIEAFTGVEEGVAIVPPTKLTDRIQECIAKLPKDIQSKCIAVSNADDRIKKLINTYSRVTEELLIEEKVETIVSEEEELNEVAQELEEIEQLTKYLNMEQLFGLNSKAADLRLLASGSKLEFVDVKEPLKAVEFSPVELQQLAEQHRKQFEQLVLLNSNIVNSLNQRVKAIDSRIAELERK